jgi:modification methylase
VAAKLLGCNYVGIDCSEEYVKVANERLTNITDDDKNTFLEEIGLHVVEKTYKERKDDKLKRRRVEPSI